MAFPTPAARNTSATTSITTAHTVALPAGIVSGDLLIAQFAGALTGTVNWPAGWTELFDTAAAGAQDVIAAVADRVADGTEGASIAVTTPTGQRAAHDSYRIADYTGTPEFATATGVDDNTGTADPPNLTPSWGAKDTLWLAGKALSAARLHSAYPASYVNGIGANTGADTAAHADIRSAERALNAASENPGTFTHAATSASWVCWTIAVRGVDGVLVSPAPASAVAASVDPTVVLGSIVAAPAPASAVAASVDPAVVLGSLVVAPAPASAVGAVVDPVVLIELRMTPAAAFAIGAVVNPTVQAGITVAPDPAAAVGETFLWAVVIVDPLAWLGAAAVEAVYAIELHPRQRA